MTSPVPRNPRFMQNMPDTLIQRVDQFAHEHGISRNAAINLLCTRGLDELAPAPSKPARNERAR